MIKICNFDICKGIMIFKTPAYIQALFYSLSQQYFKSNKKVMHHPSFQTTSPSYSNSKPLHQSVIFNAPQSPVNPPLRVVNQPVFTQPPRPEKVMYKSTIQPVSSPMNSGGLGLGRLQSMGRVIRQQVEEPKRLTEKVTVFSNQNQQPITFRNDRPQKPKMASSVIFFNKNTSENFNRFPPQDSNKKQSSSSRLSGLDFLASKARVVEEEQIDEGQDIRKTADSAVEENRKNRQMFKSSIQGQSKLKSPGSFSQMTFNPSFSKDPKKLEFHRNTSAINVVVKPEEKTKSENKTQVITKPANTVYPVTPNASRQNTAPESGMFKKKSPYIQQTSNGKTDENLLKMLGINLKGKPKQSQQESKPFDNINLQPKKQLKNEQTKNSAQKKDEKQYIKKFTKSDFLIGKKMGKGQFGEVMLVQHKLTGFICGMKVMSKKQIKSQKYQNQIARQLSIQFYLNHRNITPLYGYFQDEENIYLLVQFCTDGQLLQKLRKNRRMEEDQVSPIIRQICQGLDYVHKEEIIHRDVKPQNILFNYGTVKISDFGWAVHSGNGMRKTISGSPLYYSPQIVQQTSYDEKIDIWSIGMMTYECLLGKIPFRIYSQMDLNRIVSDDIQFPQYVDVSDEAKDFILKIMKKKPQQRMQMRQIFRHPFITKYLKDKKISSDIIEEFRNILRV